MDGNFGVSDTDQAVTSQLEKSGGSMQQDRQAISSNFPPELDIGFYRAEYPEVAGYDADLIREHFARFGIPEGRSGNHIRTRADFVALMPAGSSVLEIGPYFTPIVRGENVRYFDVLPQEGLVARAASQGVENANPPKIDYISPVGDLSVIPDRFDFAISSYCLEHQPDLIKHLQDVQTLLNPGGYYFILAPDKRFCHDHFMAESTIAGVLDAHYARRKVHPLRSIIEHVALSAHNHQVRHWAGDHGIYMEDFASKCEVAINLFQQSKGQYVDVHSWYFTPDSARMIVTTLQVMGFIGLEVARCYTTRLYNNDFWMILHKPAGAASGNRLLE